MKRRGLTAEGRQRLRLAALANRPWEHSTGPRTPEGKSRSAANVKIRWAGLGSACEVKALVSGTNELVAHLAEARRLVLERLEMEL
jgi:hypothetical protein